MSTRDINECSDLILSTDISECSSSTSHDCDEYATCLEIPGGFTCECHSGFSGDGHSCTGKISISSRCEIFPYVSSVWSVLILSPVCH